MKQLFLLLISFVLTACATNFSTLQTDDSKKQFLLAVSEEQAFQIAFSAFTTVLPGYEITDIDGPTKGYSANFRFLLDTYSQQIMVVRANAKDMEGKTINGYYFEVSGTGSSGQGRAKNMQLFEAVTAAAKATGKLLNASSIARESYTGARWKQGQTTNSVLIPVTNTPDVLTQIERLQLLRDRGAITEDEFQKKKKELLERL
jgi:hypothetical protein